LEEWETKTKYLTNFIRTEASPHIFYLPKILNPIMECRLEASKQVVEGKIQHRNAIQPVYLLTLKNCTFASTVGRFVHNSFDLTLRNDREQAKAGV